MFEIVSTSWTGIRHAERAIFDAGQIRERRCKLLPLKGSPAMNEAFVVLAPIRLSTQSTLHSHNRAAKLKGILVSQAMTEMDSQGPRCCANGPLYQVFGSPSHGICTDFANAYLGPIIKISNSRGGTGDIDTIPVF
ncbi:hypothetical protein BN77_p10229 [Rhizobium mesoamericanum STM3625]|uniref:Uncharacterized protein n=1 Tax=Rhizobium mesoamericanum STM3625 TaxID=1211777 RepID=K0PQR3_9HYPH|nr:hypothetical protein BN77_p10229 [Rhizobium mesoamericanum STM3625]